MSALTPQKEAEVLGAQAFQQERARLLAQASKGQQPSPTNRDDDLDAELDKAFRENHAVGGTPESQPSAANFDHRTVPAWMRDGTVQNRRPRPSDQHIARPNAPAWIKQKQAEAQKPTHYKELLNRDSSNSTEGFSRASSSVSLIQNLPASGGLGNVAAQGFDWWGQPLSFPDWSPANWSNAIGATFADPFSRSFSAVQYPASWPSFGPSFATPFQPPASLHFNEVLRRQNEAAPRPIGGMSLYPGMPL